MPQPYLEIASSSLALPTKAGPEMKSVGVAERGQKMNRTASHLAAILALAAIYFGLGKLALSLAVVHASATPVWPPTGIALAAVLVFGYRVWPGIWLGAFFVNLTTVGGVATSLGISASATVATSLGIATGNTLEAVVGAFLICHLANGRRVFDHARDIFRYVLLTAILSTSYSATFGVTSLVLGGFAHWDDYGSIWLTWWLGDMVSNLILAPFLLIWSARPIPRLKREHIFAAPLLLLLVVLVSETVFGGWFPSQAKNYPLSYLCIPPLLWAAFGFGRRGASATAFLMSAVAIWGTLRELGPFITGDPNESLLLLQAFMGIITVTGLVLAALVSEQKRGEEALAERARLAALRADITVALAQGDALGILLQRCADLLVCHLEMVSTGIWTVDPTEMVLELRASAGLHPPLNDFRGRVGIGEMLVGRIAQTRLPHLTNLVLEDPAIGEREWFRREGVVAFAGYPLIVESRVVGVVVLFGRKTISPNALNELAPLANGIGQCIERKRTEEALKQAKDRLSNYASELEKEVAERTCKLKEIIQSLESYSYCIAHDLRSPLRAIQGFTKLLVDSCASGINDTGRDYAQRITGSCKWMENLIRDLLTYGQLNHTELPCSDVDLEPQIDAVLAQLADEIQTTQAEVQVERPLSQVWANPTVLRQILHNLITNALKFIKAGTRPRLNISAERGKGVIRLRLTDNGIGIDRKHHERIFQVFSRQDPGDLYAGTGLGLAIVRKGAEQMGGRAGVESEPGKGSCFWIELAATSGKNGLERDGLSPPASGETSK